MTIVSNTSPLSNLAKIGKLDLLQKIYNQIIIPTSVYKELTSIGAGDIVTNALQSKGSYRYTSSHKNRSSSENIRITMNSTEH